SKKPGYDSLFQHVGTLATGNCDSHFVGVETFDNNGDGFELRHPAQTQGIEARNHRVELKTSILLDVRLTPVKCRSCHDDSRGCIALTSEPCDLSLHGG